MHLRPRCLNMEENYGFRDKNEPARATQLNLLTLEELANLPTNNIPSERIFSVFDRKAVAAKLHNHKFKAQSDQNVSMILKILSAREKEWDLKQELHENKIIEKLKKTNNQSVYTTKLLQHCKSWGGPAVSVEELHDILQKHNDIAEKIVGTELSYYRDTHKTEITYRLHLFKVNRIIHDERLINFCVLLGQNGQKVQQMNLPSNRDLRIKGFYRQILNFWVFCINHFVSA